MKCKVCGGKARIAGGKGHFKDGSPLGYWWECCESGCAGEGLVCATSWEAAHAPTNTIKARIDQKQRELKVAYIGLAGEIIKTLIWVALLAYLLSGCGSSAPVEVACYEGDSYCHGEPGLPGTAAVRCVEGEWQVDLCYEACEEGYGGAQCISAQLEDIE